MGKNHHKVIFEAEERELGCKPGAHCDKCLHAHYDVEDTTLGTGSYATVKLAKPKHTSTRTSSNDKIHGIAKADLERMGVATGDSCTELPQVAVKVIVKSGVEDLEALKNEVAIMQRVKGHPNVVSLLDVFETSRHLYLVLEMCKGGELFDRLLDVGQFSERTVAKQVKALLTAVKFCHDHSVVHRDLKPENMLLSSTHSDAALKIADFGISKVVQPGRRMRETAGSPMYVAPEILNHKAYGAECDMWSIGVITWVLLVGFPPFDGDTDADIMDAVRNETLKMDHPAWAAVSDDAKDFVNKLIVRDRKQRMTAAQALEHPWIVSGGPNHSDPLLAALDSLKQFHTMNKLKRKALLLVAEHVDESELSGLKDIFNSLDLDGSGTISASELSAALDRGGHHTTLELLKPLVQAAGGKDKQIDYKEFVACTMSRKSYLREERLYAAFKAMDVDNKGYLTLSDVAKLTDESIDEAKLTLKKADADGDGTVTYEEFLHLMAPSDSSFVHPTTTAATAATGAAVGGGAGGGAGAAAESSSSSSGSSSSSSRTAAAARTKDKRRPAALQTEHSGNSSTADGRSSTKSSSSTGSRRRTPRTRRKSPRTRKSPRRGVEEDEEEPAPKEGSESVRRRKQQKVSHESK